MSDAEKPFGFPGAGVRAGNVGRTKSAPIPWPAADWGLWADMPRATLREAVLLSMNLDPRPTFTAKAGRTGSVLSDPGPEFHRRLTLGCAHVGGYGPLRAVRVMQLLGAPGDVEVSLPEFRAWAEGLGWPMPERFPGAKAPAPAPAAAASETHKTKRRADPLAAVLTLAEQQALDAADWLSVWAALVALAQSATRPAPLVGYVEGEGVQYQTHDAKEPTGYLTREAFGKRFKRKG